MQETFKSFCLASHERLALAQPEPKWSLPAKKPISQMGFCLPDGHSLSPQEYLALARLRGGPAAWPEYIPSGPINPLHYLGEQRRKQT